jgi:NAD+ synthase
MNAQKVVNHIVDWLKNYADSANVNGFVIGVSGGIDSAVTSTLCCKTGLPVLCVEMPIHQGEKQVFRSGVHIECLKHSYPNVNAIELDLSDTFENFKSIVPKNGNDETVDLSLANTRARLRMTTLYYLAGLHNYLVVGTGNKVEDFGVGFFTKYGDGGVDLSPIADLMKSEVYELGKYLQIPESIQNAAPTDGLFGDNRTDEAQLGCSYNELEWVMLQIDQGKTSNDFKERQKEVFKIYERRHKANKHKMVPIPVCKIPESLKE